MKKQSLSSFGVSMKMVEVAAMVLYLGAILATLRECLAWTDITSNWEDQVAWILSQRTELDLDQAAMASFEGLASQLRAY